MPGTGSYKARYRARFFQIMGVSAGEAGLPGACSADSDTLLAAIRSML
jgi:hypothetical protein